MGKLVGTTARTLTFEIGRKGAVTVDRTDVSELAAQPTGPAKLPYDYVGNGTHLYLLPTARNLRRGELELQLTDLTLLNANYGITNNFSVGIALPAALTTSLVAQAGFVTPKFSVSVTDKLRLGVGAIYGFSKFNEDRVQGLGSGYGLATYGTANASLTLGLGYAFAPASGGSLPLLVLGGNLRVSRRLSLAGESYITSGYTATIVGVRAAGPRLSVGAGVLVTPFIYNSYFPVPHLDIAYRFGKAR